MVWFHFAMGILIPILQHAVKNPASVQSELTILDEVAGLIGTIKANAAAAAQVDNGGPK